MDPCQVLILAADGPLRAGLEETLLRLGHRVWAHHSPGAHEPPREGQVVLLDLRERDEDWRPMAAALCADERPLLVVSDRPRLLMGKLSARPAGMVLLAGAESDGGYRVALRLCEALRRRRSAPPEPVLATL